MLNLYFSADVKCLLRYVGMEFLVFVFVEGNEFNFMSDLFYCGIGIKQKVSRKIDKGMFLMPRHISFYEKRLMLYRIGYNKKLDRCKTFCLTL